VDPRGHSGGDGSRSRVDDYEVEGTAEGPDDGVGEHRRDEEREEQDPQGRRGSLLSPARRWAVSQSGTWVEASARSSNVLAADGSAASRDISRSNASLKRSIHVR